MRKAGASVTYLNDNRHLPRLLPGSLPFTNLPHFKWTNNRKSGDGLPSPPRMGTANPVTAYQFAWVRASFAACHALPAWSSLVFLTM
jgi:hypothetical protein